MTEFSNNKPIYLQLCDRLQDDILAGKYAEYDRIPSVREFAVMFGVNMNTSFKAIEYMARENVIFNKRGLGYFVAQGAKEKISEKKKAEFIGQLPETFRQMRLLGIDISDIDKEWAEWTKNINKADDENTGK